MQLINRTQITVLSYEMILFPFSFSLSSALAVSPARMQLSFLFVCLWNSKRFISVSSKPLAGFGKRADGRAGGSEREKNVSTFDFVFVKSIMARHAANTKEKQAASSMFGQLRNEMFSIDKNAQLRV